MKKIALYALLSAVFIVAGTTVTGCDSTEAMEYSPPDRWESFSATHVESVTVSAIPSKDTESEFLVRITLKNDLGNVRIPDAINILGQGRGLPDNLIFDSGEGVDEFAGDGVYAGIIPRECIDASEDTSVSAAKIGEITCKFDIVAPGSDCGTYGTCPETSHRSFFWGLIEYDTSVVFCFCLVECEIG